MSDPKIQAEAERLLAEVRRTPLLEATDKIAAALCRQREAGEAAQESATALHADLNRRAAKVLGKPREGLGSSWHDIPEEIERQLKAEYERGRAAGAREEREACAQMAEHHFVPGHSVAGPGFAAFLATAIRARGEKEQP